MTILYGQNGGRSNGYNLCHYNDRMLINEETTMAGLYFEEFSVGQKIITVGRTISEDAIFTFAGLTGDYNEIHTNAEFSRKTQFGRRIAHGLLGLSVATGLIMRTGFLEGTVL